ncbi:hypothetical protein BX666DRAFT_1890095 [Dichotomocladium elegans]|nr:hypothetical protein BX666DRAFT_1890095 [Dichotomocladium elegans]
MRRLCLVIIIMVSRNYADRFDLRAGIVQCCKWSKRRAIHEMGEQSIVTQRYLLVSTRKCFAKQVMLCLSPYKTDRGELQHCLKFCADKIRVLHIVFGQLYWSNSYNLAP